MSLEDANAGTLLHASVLAANAKRIGFTSMNKSTKAISLMLMGSALALAGCSTSRDDDDEDRAQRHGGVYGGARVISPGFRGGTGGGTSVSTGASARGGFGGIGGFGSGS
jgi:hypothetical protein